MKLNLILALVVSAFLPLVAQAAAADALAPIKNAKPLYEGFKSVPLAEAQRMLSEVAGPGAAPKDFVTFDGYDKNLFSAFLKLPAKRTQSADFIACTEIGGEPIYNRKITKGAASTLDYSSDGFTDAERAAIEKQDSRVLHYIQVPVEDGKSRAGVTQYLDFNKGSGTPSAPSDGINLRIGTLKNPVTPSLEITKCVKPSVDAAVFPEEILREAAETGESVQIEDKNGVLWFVRKSGSEGKWVVTGPTHLSDKAALELFEKTLAARSKNGQQPWHISRTETLKGAVRLQLIQFAKFDYGGGRSETMTLLVADGKARLGWSITDKSLLVKPSLNAGPPSPPNTPKQSFEEYLAKFSPSGRAALRLMQVAFECPDSAVAAKIDKDLIGSVVLYETMGSARPTGAQLSSMSQDKFQELVVIGVEKLNDIDGTDVSASVNCGVAQAQVDAWSAQLDAKQPDFVQFRHRMEILD